MEMCIRDRYNTPLALFLPPLQEGDTVQSVLSEYYREFNEEVRAAEEDSDEDVTYKNMQSGVARSNFTDVYKRQGYCS